MPNICQQNNIIFFLIQYMLLYKFIFNYQQKQY